MSKKNVRVIPPSVRSKLKQLRGNSIIAACSRLYSAHSLQRGALKHLGITLSSGKLSFPESALPPENQGRYSDWNVNGRIIVRKDLPIETRYRTVEVPNWGDSWNGTHDVELPYKTYPRDFIAPRHNRLNIHCQNAQEGLEHYAFAFAVDQILDQGKRSFDSDLLDCLNLLQENVGCCGVQAGDSTPEEYLRTLRVAWEVLPPGTREEAVARLFRGRAPSNEERALVEDRYDFLMSLRPAELVYGTSGMERYFGGLIRQDLVIFENIQYGNAIYIMYDDWRKLSQRTRTELQSGRFGRNFERIVHGKGWKGEVKKTIENRTAQH